MKNLILASLVLASAAHAQQVGLPQQFGPAPAASPAAMDPAPAPVMAQPSEEGGLGQWYANQKRPALVIYFDRQLDKLPAGWRGERRLLIEDSTKTASREEVRQVTVGFQRNTETAAADLSDFARVFEQSLNSEMKRQRFRVLDGVILHRRQSVDGKVADIEYASLRKSARFVFEVQLVFLGGELELIGSLKDIHTGEVPASVRMPVDSKLDSSSEIDRISRSLVQRLLRVRVG
jgi:hypothetical protein